MKAIVWLEEIRAEGRLFYEHNPDGAVIGCQVADPLKNEGMSSGIALNDRIKQLADRKDGGMIASYGEEIEIVIRFKKKVKP